MDSPTVTPTDRLRSSRDIADVLRGRRQRAGRLAVLYVRDRGDGGPVRTAVVASRKVGTAVARNRAKRLLREASRRVDWAPGLDVVLIARSSCASSRATEVLSDLSVLAERLGVLATRADAS